MKICFITAGPPHWASARIRAYWVAPYLEDAVVTPYIGDSLEVPAADVYIWQKRLDLNFMAATKGKAKHWWDICDPVWWFTPELCKQAIPFFDGVVCSTQTLADDFEAWCGKEAHVIPDRLEPAHFGRHRVHHQTTPVRFIWFGMAVNRIALPGAWPYLARLAVNGYDISLTILDDKPGKPLEYGLELPVYHIKWELENEIEVIAQHDIALLPPYPGPWGGLKSDNKAMTAAACGLPAVSGFDYHSMVSFIENWELREQYSDATPIHSNKGNHVKQSAIDWEALLCSS